MEGKVTPGAFYGSAIAALSGLLFGLLLHDAPWQDHSGGPQILFNSAAAAELARPANPDNGSAPDDQQAQGPQQFAELDGAYDDPGYIPPDPLPVTRLDPGRFGPDAADVKTASADDAERIGTDDVGVGAETTSTVHDLD